MVMETDIPGLSREQQIVLTDVEVGSILQFLMTPEASSSDTNDESAHEDSSSSDDGDGDGDENMHIENADDAAFSVHGSVGDIESEDDESESEDSSEDHSERAATQSATSTANEERLRTIKPTTLFYVRGITTKNSFIQEIEMIELKYAPLPGRVDASEHTYQIYGKEVRHNDMHTVDCRCEQVNSFLHLNLEYDLSTYAIKLNPSGDELRGDVAYQEVQDYHCPGNCNEGFLASLTDLPRVLDPRIYATAATLQHEPVCPVCVGLDLLREQQGLKASGFTPFHDAFEFWHRLSPRREHLGYEYVQFDEREWNHFFDDMTDDPDYDDDNDDQQDIFQGLPAEAMDPNAGVRASPASLDAVAALPRKTFAEVVDPEKQGERCLICREEFEAKTVVVELPCSHVFHDLDCISPWLEHSHQCPTCRAKLPAASEDETTNYDADNRDNVEGGTAPGNGEAELANSSERSDEEEALFQSAIAASFFVLLAGGESEVKNEDQESVTAHDGPVEFTPEQGGW